MPNVLQWLESDKAKKYRVNVVFGSDYVLRDDVLTRLRVLSEPQESMSLHVGDVSAAQIWDEVNTQPMPGVKRRLVVVRSADKMRNWRPLESFIGGASVYPETTLVLCLERDALGRRERNRDKSLPGSPVWETVYEPWEQALRDYQAAGLFSCTPPSADVSDPTKPSQARRWLSQRLPVSEKQTEYLWRRTGGSSLLARDVVRSLRVLGITDASVMPFSDFTSYVDHLIGMHGAEDFVDHLLFDRKPEAFSAVSSASFDVNGYKKILGLLSQRVDWLQALHGALATKEHLDQVVRRLNIPRHMVLYYAHRELARHNVARKYDARRVKRVRQILAEFDDALNASRGVPAGFGAALIVAWG